MPLRPPPLVARVRRPARREACASFPALLALFTLSGGVAAVLALMTVTAMVLALQGSMRLVELLPLAVAAAGLGVPVAVVVHRTHGRLDGARTVSQAGLAAVMGGAWGCLAVVVVAMVEPGWWSLAPWGGAMGLVTGLLVLPALRATVNGGGARALLTFAVLLAMASHGIAGSAFLALLSLV